VPIDANSFEPVHRHLARVIRTEIHRGRLPPGRLLPTETCLSRQFGVSRETARRAISLLSAEGLVVTSQVIGSFVQVPRAGEAVIAEPGTMVRSRMPTFDERRCLTVPEGVPLLVITHPGCREELALADRTTIVVAPGRAG
jgi:DNA-binding FadR family transcriptional regulator